MEKRQYKVITEASDTGLEYAVFATREEAEQAIETCKTFVYEQYSFDVLQTADPANTTFQEWDSKGWGCEKQSSDIPSAATATLEITRQALDSGKIVHTGWALCGQSTLLMDPRPEHQCDVQPGMYFDASGKFLGPDENGLEPTFAEVPAKPFYVQWEFMGRATQEHFDAAQAVADAMEIHGTTDTTKEVVAKACQILGRDWDAKSVLAMIENCSFSRIDEEASADA